jgi:RNA polymerase sigma-70 factor (ECF subfamily)
MLPLAKVQNLISRAQAGDASAFEELVEAYSPPLYRVVRRYSDDDQEAESFVQEAFWRVWRSLERYQNDRPFFPYLVTIAVRLVRDRWRSEKWLMNVVDIDADENVSEFTAEDAYLEDQVVSQEQTEAVEQAVASLPRPYRIAISLRYQAGYSYEKIAEILELPTNTVRTHLHRAKKMLQKYLAQWESP